MDEIWLELTLVYSEDGKLRKRMRMLDWNNIVYMDRNPSTVKHARTVITINGGNSFSVEETIEEIFKQAGIEERRDMGFKGDKE